jgi:hypothetical protein
MGRRDSETLAAYRFDVVTEYARVEVAGIVEDVDGAVRDARILLAATLVRGLP